MTEQQSTTVMDLAALGPRKIVHVDMDAFYASVEQRDDASLGGRPVALPERVTYTPRLLSHFSNRDDT